MRNSGRIKLTLLAEINGSRSFALFANGIFVCLPYETRDPLEAGRRCVDVGKLGPYKSEDQRRESIVAMSYLHFSDFHIRAKLAIGVNVFSERRSRVVQRHGRAAADV